MFQNMLYTTLVEDRLKHLEKSLRELQNKGNEPSPWTKVQKKEKHILEIKYLKWAEFKTQPLSKEDDKPWVHKDPFKDTPMPILEVLIEGPQISGRHRRRGNDIPVADNTASSKATTSDDISNKAQRLRIRSPLLIKILTKFAPNKDLGLDDTIHSITLLSPFKLLILYAEQIKDHLAKLEEIHKPTVREKPADEAKSVGDSKIANFRGDANSKSINDPFDNTSGKSNKEDEKTSDTESYEALEHIRLLVKFMNEDLQHIWDLQQQIKEKTLTKIAFTDLWHLFERGQDIRSQEDNIKLQM
jgi:hypothetical protein